MSERHACIFPLPERSAVDLLNCWGLLPPWEVLCLPKLKGPIPEDAKVMDLRENWEYRTLDVRLEHPSFPVWKDGEWCPRSRDWLELEMKAINLHGFGSAKEERERCLKILDFLANDTESPVAKSAFLLARRKIAGEV